MTSFTIDPAGDGSRIPIETVWDGRGGLAGLVERLMIPRLLGSVYQDELDRIEAWARAETGRAIGETFNHFQYL